MASVARYVLIKEGSLSDVKQAIEDYFATLDIAEADYDPIDLQNKKSTLAMYQLNYEIEIQVEWDTKASYGGHTLRMYAESHDQEIDVEEFHEIIGKSAERHFDLVLLTFNSIGHLRHLEALPIVYEFESKIREFILLVLISQHGDQWWKTIEPIVGDKFRKYRKSEEENYFHEFYDFFSQLYYLDFDDLRKIIQECMTQDTNSLFHEVFSNYENVDIPGRIGELRTIRNQVMHGKYLSKDNMNSLSTTTRLVTRFIQKKGYGS